jgi:hypothetical protein
MFAAFKRVRWAVLLACYVVVAKACGLFRIALPMNSIFRPHNLVRFRPDDTHSTAFVSCQIRYPRSR